MSKILAKKLTGIFGQIIISCKDNKFPFRHEKPNTAIDGMCYLNYQVTIPYDLLVVEAMLPYFYEDFGNMHSQNHVYGWHAEKAVETAWKHIADLIGTNPQEIVFSSGATKSNNLALKGVMNIFQIRQEPLLN